MLLLYIVSFKEFGSLVCLWHDVKLRKTQLEVRSLTATWSRDLWGHRVVVFLEMWQIVGWTAMANLAALRAAVFSLSAKNLRGVEINPPPAGARVNQQYDFQKCQMSKYDFLLTWPWVWMLLWMCVFEICHSLSPKATGWHWRGHRLLRVALSEIRGLDPKWSFATDTQRILNIRSRISPRWRFCPVAWPNLIKDFLDVQIIRNACSWQWRKFQVIHCTCSKVIDEKYRQSVCSAVCCFAVPLHSVAFHNCVPFRSRSRPVFFTAPAPAPRKPFRRLRLRLRPKCVGSGGSGSGSGSASLLPTL